MSEPSASSEPSANSEPSAKLKPKESLEQSAFREQCAKWLANNGPGEAAFDIPHFWAMVRNEEQVTFFRQWQKKLYDAGIIACDYPLEYGGGGLKNCQAIANQEMRKAKALYTISFVGLALAAPMLLIHASEELKKELLPKIFSGEHLWCQGFSEPNFGSDLVSMQTSAVKEGDNWRINGHKVWTSLAHFADWMFVVCRTDKNDKYGGLTFFVLPVKEYLKKGVTINPLVKITGEPGFNEVIFEDVIIPDSYRIDEVGAGWKVVQTVLAHERSAGKMVTPSYDAQPGEVSVFQSPYSLIKLAKESERYGVPASSDQVIRDKLAKLIMKQVAHRNLNRRAKVQTLCENPMRLALQMKVNMTDMVQESTALALEIQGVSSLLSAGDSNAPHKGEAMFSYYNSFGLTIAGGTNEIQRNILGEKILGLPKTK